MSKDRPLLLGAQPFLYRVESPIDARRMSCQLPAELLKIRLNQQLSRLKENLNGNNNNNNNNSATAAITRNDEDKFTLYQRIVSWFIMGRLSKYEYDRVLESLLETSEQIGKIE